MAHTGQVFEGREGTYFVGMQGSISARRTFPATGGKSDCFAVYLSCFGNHLSGSTGTVKEDAIDSHKFFTFGDGFLCSYETFGNGFL